MKNTLQYFALCLIALIAIGTVSTNAQSKEEIEKKLHHAITQERNSQGRDFYVAFPLNERKNFNTQTLAIYVTSSVNTKVTISNPLIGFSETKNVTAMGITEFSSTKGGFSWDYEIQDFEQVLNLGFRISSPDPISVYCMNSKQTTSDGYLAIPTKFWGTEYIHNCYYDFNESYNWGSGFVVIGSEDNTQVTIKLKDGVNNTPGFGETFEGKVHGDVIRIILNKNEVYAIQGNGQTRGTFDLSGSSISSDQPVGLLSYSNRAMIPVTTVTNGRDHLIEMLPPITAWGKQYATVEYARGKDKGDYFRVVASEPNTTFTANWFEKGSGDQIGSWGPITLKQKGDWVEYGNAPVTAPHNYESIRGMTVIKADKPILVGQYSYSANYDNANQYDPFYILVTAVEQYTKNTVFQTPANYSNNEFRNNYFNIIAIGDTSDEVNNKRLLETVVLDGDRVADIQPAFLGNRIPGTNLYWAFISQLPQGTHRITGETPFGGYVYGFANVDSYGWPAATAYANLLELDTLPPIVSFPDGCFEWIVNNIDDPENPRNGKEGDNPRQVDVGVRELPMLMPGSFNFDDPVYLDENGDPAEWDPTQPNYDFDYLIKVTDPYENGQANLRVFDDVGNITDTTIYYYVDKLDRRDYSLGKVTVRDNKFLDIPIKSLADAPITIDQIYLKVNDTYQIETDLSFLPYVLEAGADTTITIVYTPIDEYIDLSTDPKKQFDFDTLVVETGCLPWEYALDGQGVQPEIRVKDYNAGITQVGGFTLSNGAAIDDGVEIQNDGTDTLIVTGLRFVAAPFSLPNMPPANINGDVITFDTPIKVAPRGEPTIVKFGHDLNNRYLIRFSPTSLLNVDNSIDVTFISNAALGDAKDIQDSISRWYGTAQSNGPIVLPATYPNTRVDATSDFEYVVVRNLAPSEGQGSAIRAYVAKGDLSFEFDNGNYMIHPTENIVGYDKAGNIIAPNIQSYVDLEPDNSNVGITEVRIPVLFTPQAAGLQTDSIVVRFTNLDGSNPSIGKALVSGPGFLPEVRVDNMFFTQTPDINTGVLTTEKGVILINNVTQLVDVERTSLVVKSIGIDPNAPEMNQFENFQVTVNGTDIPIADFANLPLNDRTLPINSSFRISFDFNTDGAKAGTNIGRMEIISDAGPADNGNEPNSENRYDVVFDDNYTADNQSAIDDGGYIVANTNSIGVEVTNGDFESKTLCEAPVVTIRARNNAGGNDPQDETIDFIRPVNAGQDYFDFVAADYQNVPIAPGGSIPIRVTYKVGTPAGNYDGTQYEAVFVSGRTAQFTISGVLTENVFEFSLDNGGGYDLTPGDEFNLNVFVQPEAGSSFEDAKISELDVVIKYKESWLNYIPGDLTDGRNGWNVDQSSQVVSQGGENWIEHRFQIRINGGEYIKNAGVLIAPKFLYLLHEVPEGQEGFSKFEIHPEIERAVFVGKTECNRAILVPGEIRSQFCIQNFRAIGDLLVNENTEELMEPISPNPVKNNMNMNFLVGTKSKVSITMTNVEGKLAKTILDSEMASGVYDTQVDVSDLPSGVYYLTFENLGAKETQKIVITQ